MSRRVVLAINAAWNIANFRAGLIRGLQADGWEVIAVAPRDAHVPRVEALGCRFVPIDMAAGGTNPLQDWRLYRDFRRILEAEAPNAFLGFTIKPNVFGGLAAQGLRIPVINNIAGLGTAFIRQSWLTHVARLLYRHSLRRSHCVLFQNEDDRRYFIETGLVDAQHTQRVPGSGIDLRAFGYCEPPPVLARDPRLRVLFIGRILRDKGVIELIEAARLLLERRVPVRIQMLGFCDTHNPTAISTDQLAQWQAEGLIEYLGSTDDVRPVIAQCHAVVLPSYREGVPRTLLEAAAMGRPLVASDAVGCRDAVDAGVNGLLARVRDAADLAYRIEQFVDLPMATRLAWGRASRDKMEREFDERLVVQVYRQLLADLPLRKT